MKVEDLKVHVDSIFDFFRKEAESRSSSSLSTVSKNKTNTRFSILDKEKTKLQFLASLFSKKSLLNEIDFVEIAFFVFFRINHFYACKNSANALTRKHTEIFLRHYEAIFRIVYKELSLRFDRASLVMLFPNADLFFLRKKGEPFQKKSSLMFNRVGTLDDIDKKNILSQAIKRIYLKNSKNSLMKILLELDHEFLDGLLAFERGSENYNQYVCLRQITHPLMRTLIDNLKRESPESRKKMRRLELISLDDFGRFIRNIDPDKYKLEPSDVRFLKEHIPELTPSNFEKFKNKDEYKKFKSALCKKLGPLSTLFREDNLKLKEIYNLIKDKDASKKINSSQLSLINKYFLHDAPATEFEEFRVSLQDEKFRNELARKIFIGLGLEQILTKKLKPPRMFYFENRLKYSVNLRLGHRFLIDLVETHFRPMFLQYAQPALVEHVNFHVAHPMIVPEKDYTETFCSMLIDICSKAKKPLTPEKQLKLKDDCRKIEKALYLDYQGLFKKEITHIPARLQFEEEIFNMLSKLYETFAETYAPGLLPYESLIKGETSSCAAPIPEEMLRLLKMRTSIYKQTGMAITLKGSLFVQLMLEHLIEIAGMLQYRTKVSRSLLSHGFIIGAPNALLNNFHLTHYTEDPFNLYYIEFAQRLVKAMNHLKSSDTEPYELDLVLFGSPGFMRPNLTYAEKYFPDRYHRALVNDAVLKMHRITFTRDPNSTVMARVFHEPEFFGLYHGADGLLCSVIGLLLANGAQIEYNDKKIMRLTIPNAVSFRLLSAVDVDLRQARALTLSEINDLWSKEYRFKTPVHARSFPLCVKEGGFDRMYPSFKALIKKHAVSHWSYLEKPNWSLVFDLIRRYLTTDPQLLGVNCWEIWLESLTEWEASLLYLNPEQEIKLHRSIASVHALYGQLIDGKMYLFELLGRVFENVKYLAKMTLDHKLRDTLIAQNKYDGAVNSLSRVVDELMTSLVNWYLTQRDDELKSTQQDRLSSLAGLYREAFERSNSLGELYFNKSNTRYENLANSLSQKGKIQKNYRKFMIPTLKRDEEIVSLEDITTIPFEDAILSENGQEIYDLRISAETFKQTGSFLNVARACSFSDVERQRIKTHAHYYKYYWRFIETGEDAMRRALHQKARLSSEMINAIREFIDGTYLLQDEISAIVGQNKTIKYEGITITPECYRRYHNGGDTEYDELILSIIYKRVDRFIFGFYLKLSNSDKAIFDHYLIYNPKSRQNIYLKELIAQFTDPSHENRKTNYCLSICIDAFFKVVISYDPVIRFRDFIEVGKKNELIQLRNESPQFECSDACNSPILYRLKVTLFKLKLMDGIPSSLYREVEKKLKEIPIHSSSSGLKSLHEQLEMRLQSERENISQKIKRESTLFNPSPKTLCDQRYNLDQILCILRTQSISHDDPIIFYHVNRLETSFERYIKNGYTIAITKRLSDISTHFAEVEYNVELQRYLQSLPEAQSKKLKRFLETDSASDVSMETPKCK